MNDPIDILFATGNIHKLNEANRLIAHLPSIRFLGLQEAGILEDLQETGMTLEENALQKAKYIQAKYGYDCFSEDTGLEVFSLGGAPGVHSARYAGPERDAQANMHKLLEALQGSKERKARFRTVICLLFDKKSYYFEGIVNGQISTEKMGNSGFGYDPVFIPDGYFFSFAQMELSQKNEISHRGQAIRKLVIFLENLKQD